jgi:O-glycosyl hydrolase
MMTRPRTARGRAIGLGLAIGLGACGAEGDGNGITNPVPCAADPIALPQTDVTVTLDPSQRFQTIHGFGTTQRLFDDPHITETFNPATARAAIIPPAADQDRILDALYRDLRLTRVRFHPEGVEPVNDNADPLSTDLSKFNFSWKAADGHIAAVKALQARGVTTYFASPLRVESWMDESNPDEYVEWAMAILRHWRSAGMEMPYFSLMNEPSYYGGMKSWSGAWLRDVAKRLGARLKAEGFATKLVAPDDLSPNDAYARLQTILADPDARQYIGAVAYHLYGRGNEDKVAQLARQYGIPVWMTEYSTPNDWRAWADIMHDLLATDDVSAIDYMWGYFGDWDGSQLVRVKVSGSSYAGFDFNRQYYVMGQYSRYVRPGAVRIAATSSDDDLEVVAFLDGARPVVVVTNLGQRDYTVRFELGSAGVCGTRFESVRTSDTDAWKSLPDVTIDQPRFAARASAGSVTTFVGR